jgi:hypothetical protein
MRNRTPSRDSPPPAAWYRQGVLWLGIVLLVASLAGCIGMIVLGARHADEPLPTGAEIFRVPVARPAPPPDPAQATP